MEHEGKALAADETDSKHHRPPGIATVHTRAVLTWIAIFPLVAIGMSVLSLVAAEWPPVLRALVLTLVVVPTTVYLIVPQLLMLHSTVATARHRRRSRHLSARGVREVAE